MGRFAGPYERIRHSQYTGFVMSMFGLLLQWPAIVALAMFPFPVFMYVRARAGEKEAGTASIV